MVSLADGNKECTGFASAVSAVVCGIGTDEQVLLKQTTAAGGCALERCWGRVVSQKNELCPKMSFW